MAQFSATVSSFMGIYIGREREHLHLEQPRSSQGQRSIKFKGSYLWNSLLDELKSVISAQSFAKRLKKFMNS